MSATVTIEVPDGVLESLGGTGAELGREVLAAAVLRWFEEGRLSQGQAAATLGLNRGAFIGLLNERRISPVQMSVSELEEDFRRG